MEILSKVKDKWGIVGEWLTIMAPIFGLFLYCHHENTRVNERLDNHITSINLRSDQINQRCDLLHQEFIDLLKELRK